MNHLIDQLDAGYVEVVGLYQELLVLAQSIAKSLERGQWEGIDKQLGEKQVIMDTIDAREVNLSELRERVRRELALEEFSLSVLLTDPSATKLSNTIEGLMDVIEELQKWEKNNEDMLRKLVAGVQGQIEDFSRGKRAAKAYSPGPRSYGEARFVDKKK